MATSQHHAGAAAAGGTVEPALLTLEQTSKACGLGLNRTRRLVVDGEINSICIGRRRYIPAEAIGEFVRRRMSAGRK